MSPTELAHLLAKLTDGWMPGPGIKGGALQQARQALAVTLTSGMPADSIHAARGDLSTSVPDTRLLTEMESFFVSPAPEKTEVAAYIRSGASVTVENPAGAPAWARGMKVQQTLGPFLNAAGIPHFVDIVPLTVSVKFAFGTATNVFGVFPVSFSILPLPVGESRLGAGSVWFVAKLMVPTIPAQLISGFRIRSGTLKASLTGHLQNGVYVLPATATLTISATLDQPVASAIGGTVGLDATASDIKLPDHVTISFTQGGAKIETLGDSHAAIYGSSLDLAYHNQAPIALDQNTWLLAPCKGSASVLDFKTVLSQQFTPSGKAALTTAGWVLPISTAPVTAAGEAAGAGSIYLQLGAGASLECHAHPIVSPTSPWKFLLSPETIFALVPIGSTGTTVSYDLWQEQEPSTRHSSVSFGTGNNALVSYLATPGKEVLTALGVAAAHLDRPLAADGSRFPVSGPALFQDTLTETQETVLILAAELPQLVERIPIVLTNAVIGVNGPTLFVVYGEVQGSDFLNAAVGLLLNARWLLPTAPDPYAANFDLEVVRRESANGIGNLALVLLWNGVTVSFNFFLVPDPATPNPAGAFLAKPSPSRTAEPFSQAALLGRNALSNRELTSSFSYWALLDLSTRVDQFGVAIAPSYSRQDLASGSSAPAIGFDGVSLAANSTLVATFALPQVSWEPMDSMQTPPGPLLCNPASDGVPTIIQAPDNQRLVPVEPMPVLSSTVANVARGKSFTATFSLPFGLIASVRQPNEPPSGYDKLPYALKNGGAFHLTRPRFAPSLTGAWQLTLKPRGANDDPAAQFPGVTIIYQHHQPNGYGDRVLGGTADGSSVGDIFNGEFGTGELSHPPTNPGVPVRRADLAGYGASIWSEWADQKSIPPNITKVHFETVVGRTALEVIQAVTVLYPYGAKLVRTITIERQNTGWMKRTDSGWQAASNGTFHFPFSATDPDKWAGHVHPGAVAGVFNLRNIRELADQFTAGPAGNLFGFRKVLFDADIGLTAAVDVRAGGKPGKDGVTPITLVPSRDLVGYIQLSPDKATPPPDVLADLFTKTGPVTPAFSCVVQLGAHGTTPGTIFRCSAIEVKMAINIDPGAPLPTPALGAALRGAPNLPRDGHWGVGQRLSTQPAPSPLPGDYPVPIIQATNDLRTWHIADIADVLQLANPDSILGLLQDTGTQKILFEQPRIPIIDALSPAGSVPGIQLPNPPNFADVASLLNATGLFPDLSSTISLFTGVAEQLNTLQDGLQYSKKYPFDKRKPPLTLLDLGVIKVELSYCDESKGRDGTGAANAPTVLEFHLDPTAVAPAHRWSFSVTPLSFMVTVPEFSANPILMVIGGFVADDQTRPTLSGLHIVYGDALSSLTSVLDKLQALAQFLPGGKGSGLQVGLSDGRLTVREVFAIPTLPLGLGDITDVSLEVGLALQLSPLTADFSVAIGNPDKPFNWIVSPLSGNGLIDIGVKDGKPELTVQAGIGLGLAIDLAIASGSASVTIAIQLDVTGSTITLMAVLTGRASVDVLGGLVGATLTLSAAVGFSLKPPLPTPTPILGPPPEIHFPKVDITLLASVSVGIHISICWVVSVDWDGSWQFAQTITTPELNLAA